LILALGISLLVRRSPLVKQSRLAAWTTTCSDATTRHTRTSPRLGAAQIEFAVANPSAPIINWPLEN
jgi:hypothetical protein